MFGWGSTCSGQLGCGAIEESCITQPTQIDPNFKDRIKSIAVGREHSIVLTASGELWSCGSNECGELATELAHSKFAKINTVIRFERIACGDAHTIAISTNGELYSFGSTASGVLCRHYTQETLFLSIGPIEHSLQSFRVSQIACGKRHCLAITTKGSIYSWGDNEFGQLGVGVDVNETVQPHHVFSLTGLPIIQIVCGGFHNLVLTNSRAVFSWGHGQYGQLGIGALTPHAWPTSIKALRNLRVSSLSAGLYHSVVVTELGGLLTFGLGSSGQLGHDSTSNEARPKQVLDLMGTDVIKAACGRRHTLVVTRTPSGKKLLACGLNATAQLGNGTQSLSCALRFNEVTQMPSDIELIATGGDHNFLLTSSLAIPPRNLDPDPITIPFLKRLCQSTVSVRELNTLETCFSSLELMNKSFLQDNHYNCCNSNIGLDIDAILDNFERLGGINNVEVERVIRRGIETHLLPFISQFKPLDYEALRIFIILPLVHVMDNPLMYRSLLVPYARALLRLEHVALAIIEKWWERIGKQAFSKLLAVFRTTLQHVATIPHDKESVRENEARVECLMVCVRAMERIYGVNVRLPIQEQLPARRFYLPELTDKIHLDKDFIVWMQQQQASEDKGPGALSKRNDFKVVAICNFPFLLNVASKARLLHVEAIVHMRAAIDAANYRNISELLIGSGVIESPFLVLSVRRENFVADTFSFLSVLPARELKKPLRVKFEGEEGMDAGGVRKELFMMIMDEMMNVKYGMFKPTEAGQYRWFTGAMVEENDKQLYFLVGLICGLSIYNDTIIDLRFPEVLYKKLLSKIVDLEDLADMDPTMYKGLKHLLEYNEPDIEEVFDLNFEVNREIFGETIVYPLVPNGASIQVTNDNKSIYVNTYVDYILNKQVEEQYSSFAKGFMRVCGESSVLNFFQPAELMELVAGNPHCDLYELREHTKYQGYYNSTHPTINYFWQVLLELNERDKTRFMMFLTGSPRVPVQGMQSLNFVIQPMGTDEHHIPVAHTCFNILDLPSYSSPEILRSKLMIALDNYHGFSLV